MRREHADEDEPPRSASLRDVARRAGVSVTTVSHALSGKRHVAPKTARRIRELVPELGYVPYAAARSLQSGRTLFIGLIVPDIANQFFGEIARGASEYADEQGYGVILCASHSEAREKRYFNLLRSKAVDGLIYNARDATADAQLPALARKFPIVIVDEAVPDVVDAPLIAADHLSGGILAGEHLAGLGHRHTAVFTGPSGLLSSRERTAGFLRSFPHAVVLEGDYTETSGRILALAIADAHPEVTAVFATSDTMAFGALEGFAARGIRVPADMSVVGFDDIDFAARISPPLTTIQQPAIDLGWIAAQRLLDHIIDGRRLGEGSSTLPVRLIVRESTTLPRVSKKGK